MHLFDMGSPGLGEGSYPYDMGEVPKREREFASEQAHPSLSQVKSSQSLSVKTRKKGTLEIKLGRPLVPQSRLSTLGHQKRRESSSWISADTSAKKVLLCDLCAIFYRCFDS